MTIEEFDRTIEDIPRTKSELPISTYNSINVEELRDFVKTFRKIPTYDELLKENERLKELISKLKNQPTVYLTKYMDKFGFVETKTLNELIEELESSDK